VGEEGAAEYSRRQRAVLECPDLLTVIDIRIFVNQSGSTCAGA
jgi:hypothetical protein